MYNQAVILSSIFFLVYALVYMKFFAFFVVSLTTLFSLVVAIRMFYLGGKYLYSTNVSQEGAHTVCFILL